MATDGEREGEEGLCGCTCGQCMEHRERIDHDARFEAAENVCRAIVKHGVCNQTEMVRDLLVVWVARQ